MPGMAFCNHCGTSCKEKPLVVRLEACRACGLGVAANAVFCNHCGTSCVEEAAPPSPCGRCGTLCAGDAVFCNRCGASCSGQGEMEVVVAPCRTCGEVIPVASPFCNLCGSSRHGAMRPQVDDSFDFSELDGTGHTIKVVNGKEFDPELDGTLKVEPSLAYAAEMLEELPFGRETSVSETFESGVNEECGPQRVRRSWAEPGLRCPHAAIAAPPLQRPPSRSALRPDAQAAGAGGVAVRQLRIAADEGSQAELRHGRSTQTESRGGAGRIPPPAPPVPTKAEALQEEALGPSPQVVDWSLPRDNDAPYFSAALRYIKADRVEEAFQCVFRFGNEKTLSAVLKRLKAMPTWQRLPDSEARYLAHLLSMLVCKEPLAASSVSACAWLDSLLRLSGGAGLLAAEDLPGLQAALFNLSGAAGDGGLLASSIYYRLFQIGGG